MRARGRIFSKWAWAVVASFLGSAASAETRSFPMAGGEVRLERRAEDTEVFFRALRLNRATDQWNVDVTVRNRGARPLTGLVLLRFEAPGDTAGVAKPDGVDPEGKAFIDLTPRLAKGQLAAGAELPPFTLALAKTARAPKVDAVVFSTAAVDVVTGSGVTRTLDAAGLPLPGVTAEGVVSERGGWLTFTGGEGAAVTRFDAPGRLPVFRFAATGAGVTELPPPRLASRAADDSTLGGAKARVTPLTPQTLTAPLPLGWSPLAAAFVEFAAEPAAPVATEFTPSAAVLPGEQAVLVRWDAARPAWKVVGLVAGKGTDPVPVTLPGSGAFALVVPDAGVPAAAVGQDLPASPLAPPAEQRWTATGKVMPASRPASVQPEQVTTMAQVVFRSTVGALPSGVALRCAIREEYLLRDGSRRVPPRYETFVTGHQRPGDTEAGTLTASFPLRPLLLLPGEELGEARITVEVLAPGTFAGRLLTPAGGTLGDGDLRLVALADVFATPQAARLAVLAPSDLAGVATGGQAMVAAFELDLAGVRAGRRLLPAFAAQTPGASFVLARTVFTEGLYGLQPVERFVSDAAGNLVSSEPANGERLPGIDGGGQYLLLQAPARSALVSGVARDRAGRPAAGLAVRAGPWLAFTDPAGRYQVLAPAGVSDVSISDPRTGDIGSAGLAVASDLAAVSADLDTLPHGPRVLAVAPADGAVNVARVTPVTLNFSRPLDPATLLGEAVKFTDASGAAVPASSTLNLARTALMLLPTAQLPANARLRIALAPTIADVSGLAMEGPREFSFTTESDVLRRADATLVIFEPSGGVAPMVGGPGLAEPDSPVILVNETTGFTSTVLSKTDGSFSNNIPADVDDLLSSVIVNRNGTRNTVPASRQNFRDGRVGLYSGGGVIESPVPSGAPPDVRPVQVVVDAGAVPGKTVFTLEPLSLADLRARTGEAAPVGATLLGAFRFSESGDELKTASHVAIPVTESELKLPPGSDPEKNVFALLLPLAFDGQTAYVEVDDMRFERTEPGRGRLITRSPPFVGLLGRKLELLRQATQKATLPGQVTLASTGQPSAGGGSPLDFIYASLNFGEGSKIAGKVVGRDVDDHGVPTGTEEPIAGAVVYVDFTNGSRPAGLINAGEMIALSDETGHFGFTFRPSEAGVGRELRATHPRFPFQTAGSPGFVFTFGATEVARVTLQFAKVPSPLVGVTDTAPPSLQASHLPLLPVASAKVTDFATVTLTASDDVSIGDPDLKIFKAVGPDGAELAPGKVTIQAQLPVKAGVSRVVRGFKVHCDVAAKVVLKATVADDGGHSVEFDYTVNFGLGISLPPGDGKDTTAPFISLAWPPNGSEGIPSLSPILLRFAEPVAGQFLQPTAWATWLTLDGQHKLRSVEASPDRREVKVFYSGATDGTVSLTVAAPLTDDSGNSFDQNPGESGAQSFSSQFKQAGQRKGALPAEGQGGGIVFQGRFAYALDRQGGDDGRLVSFDLAKPGEAEEVDAFDFNAFPTTLSLISGQPLKTGISIANGQATGGTCETKDLVAVFTGSATQEKTLWLVPANGSLPGFFGPEPAKAVVSRSPASQIVKSKWDAPFLGFFELGADVTSVALIDLNAFHLFATDPDVRRNAPAGGAPGKDLNGDGDYCDEGEFPPLPARSEGIVPGLQFTYAPTNKAERIQDFDFVAGAGLAVAVHTFTGAGGPPNLRVLLSPSAADLAGAVTNLLPQETPKRVLLLSAQKLETPFGPVLRDLALVSIRDESATTGDGLIVVADVSDPGKPVILTRVPLPAGEGVPGSFTRRSDGSLALAASRNMLLVDPTKLLLPTPAAGLPSPAFIGVIEGTGGGVRDFASDPSGVNLAYSGNNRQLVQAEPRLQVVTFSGTPLDPAVLVGQPRPVVEQLLRNARPVSVVELAKTNSAGEVFPDLAPERHHYVLVDAPGGDVEKGKELPLVIAGINARGQLYDRNSRNAVPAVIGDKSVHNALMLKQLFRLIPSIADAFGVSESTGQELSLSELAVSLATSPKAKKGLAQLQEFCRLLKNYPLDFKARRLSDDPASPLYNRYLAGPFLVLPNSPEQGTQVGLLKEAQDHELKRVYLRASPRLWVGFPSATAGFAGNPVLGQFASRFRLNPAITLSGVSVPLVSGLAEKFVDLFVGESDLIGPAALLALETLAKSVEVPPLQLLKTDLKPTLLPGANVLCQVNYRDRPLVFVPGFAGSRLNDVEQGEIWPSVVTGQFLDPSALQVTPGGETFFKTAASDALRAILEVGDLRVKNIYGRFLRSLSTELGYVEYDYLKPPVPGDKSLSIQQERRRFKGSPDFSQEPAPDLFVFAYDWRLDDAKAARQLGEYVELMRYYHPDADGIDLIAHSNGNLVSREYMLKNPGVVRRYLAVAAPWLGSNKPMLGLLTGDIGDAGVSLALPFNTMRQASQFMPGFHQLLLNKGAFDLGLREITEAGWDLNRNGDAYQRYGYDDYADALQKHFFRETHKEVGFTAAISPVRKNHEDFQRPDLGLPVGNGSKDGPEVEFHELIGMQSAPHSPGGLRFAGRLHRSAVNVQNVTLDLAAVSLTDSEDGVDVALNVGEGDGPLGITTNQFRLRGDLEAVSTLGDGTVPILSLARGFGSGLNLNPEHTKLHCLVSRGVALDESVGHNPILDHPTFRDWVRRIMTGRAIPQLKLEVDLPAQVNEGSLFTVGATASGSNGEGGEVTTLFDFADGGTAARVTGFGSAAQVSRRYRQNGTYTVSVGATTADDVTDFTSRQIKVVNVPPTVKIDGGDLTVGWKETHIFTAKVFDPGLDDTHTFEWRLNDRVLAGEHGFALAVNFTEPGVVKLKVIATDSDHDSGTDEITVTVDATKTSADPLSVATASARGAQKAAPPLVFESQPKLFARITGAAPGPFETAGITVRENGAESWVVENFQIPFGFLSPSLSQVFKQVRRLATAVLDAAVQRTSADTITVDLLQTKDAEGGSPLTSFLDFKARGGPLEIELLYSQGGTPTQLTRWETNAPPDQEAGIRFDWQTAEGTPLFENTLTLAGQAVAPVLAALGPAAGDRLPPVVLAVHNPVTDDVAILGRDNFTPASKLEFFLAQDTSGDGRLDDEVFYRLSTNHLARTRLPSRPFCIVARDGAGNVSAATPLTLHTVSDFAVGNAGYCDELGQIRTAVTTAVTAGLNAPAVHDLFLLDPAHLWVFEQGSGACLWKADSCRECNGNFVPGLSDNDYELFLPVHLGRNYQFNATDRAEFLASVPHEPSTRSGDWYFRTPRGLDAAGNEVGDLGNPANLELVQTWEYTLPLGFATPTGDPLLLVPRKTAAGADLGEGFPLPFTPAEVISRTFTRVIADDEDLKARLEQTTFFPARREHFMFGVLDLDLPPAEGNDSLGDAGTGRQMLLLKWVLEGAFVPLNGLGVNQGLPSLAEVYQNLKDSGIPTAEGLEWGLFQEYAALLGKVNVDARATYGPADDPRVLLSGAGNSLYEQQSKKLKKLGKAGIRAALARLAGDPETSHLLFDLSLADYHTKRLASFEDFILAAIDKGGVAATVFGDFGRQRPTEEGPDIFDFLEAKRGNEQLFREVLSDPEGYRRFLTGTFDFLRRKVQLPTDPGYRLYDDRLRTNGLDAERFLRGRNLHLLLHGDGAERRGLADLRKAPGAAVQFAYAVHNFTDHPVAGLKVQQTTSGGPNAAARRPRPAAPPSPQTVADAPALSGSANEDPTEPRGEVVDTEADGKPASLTATLQSDATQEGEAVGNDDTLKVEVETQDMRPPAVADEPFRASLFIKPARGPVILLTDWDAADGHPRSPRYVLRRDDRLDLTVFGPAGQGPLQAIVQTESNAGLGRPATPLTLPEDFAGAGLYNNRDSLGLIRFSNNPNEAGALYVKDEELLTVEFRVPSTGQKLTAEVMIDLGELAIATVSHEDRDIAGKPRFDYEETFLDAPNGFHFDSAGVIEFPDDVAKAAFDAGKPGGDNAMRRFLQAFSDPTHPETGEGDVLYLHTHGGKGGDLSDHISDRAPGNSQRRLVLSPGTHLADQHRWNSDAEWFISEACSILNPALDNQLQPIPGFVAGVTNWMRVLTNSARPIHGILGFAYGKAASRPVTEDFLRELRLELGYVETWKAVWEEADPPRPWAMLYFKSARGDTVREVGQDPLPTDAIRYESFLGAPQGECGDEAGCCGDAVVATNLTAGVWVHPAVLALPVPAGVARSLPARRTDLLQPAPRLARSLQRSAGREGLRPAGAGQVLAIPGATDAATARQRAEGFLVSECGFDRLSLRWRSTGEARAQTFQGGVGSPPEVTARVVHFDVMMLGLPLSGAGVTVNVTSDGITRVGVRRVPLPQAEKAGELAKPLEVADALAKAQASLSPDGATAHVFSTARLCWWTGPLPDQPDAVGTAVPAWEFDFAPADASGSSNGLSRKLWLDAITGGRLEVSE